jgi:Ca2+-binding EF-hand superfamily protein
MLSVVRWSVVAIGVLVLGTWTAPCFAQADETAATAKDKAKGKKNKGAEAMFKKLDTNNDGKLSREEFAKITELRKKKGTEGATAKKGGKRIDKLFDRLDTNKDGFLSLEEFKQMHQGRKAKK